MFFFTNLLLISFMGFSLKLFRRNRHICLNVRKKITPEIRENIVTYDKVFPNLLFLNFV